jgi:cysteine desulfurase
MNMRAGTESVPLIVGFAKAATLKTDLGKMQKLRDRLVKGLMQIPETTLNGSKEKRLPNNVNISFHRIEGEAMLLGLDAKGVAISTGSACTSKSLKPSHVLMAMGIDAVRAHGSLRFTLSKFNTEEEIDYVIKSVKEVVERLRSMTAI